MFASELFGTAGDPLVLLPPFTQNMFGTTMADISPPPASAGDVGCLLGPMTNSRIVTASFSQSVASNIAWGPLYSVTGSGGYLFCLSCACGLYLGAGGSSTVGIEVVMDGVSIFNSGQSTSTTSTADATIGAQFLPVLGMEGGNTVFAGSYSPRILLRWNNTLTINYTLVCPESTPFWYTYGAVLDA